VKQTTTPVLSCIAYRVGNQLSPEDQEKFWRMRYALDQLHRADRSYRYTRTLLVCSFLFFLFAAGRWPETSFFSFATLLILFQVTRAYRRLWNDRLVTLVGEDEERWRTFGEPLVELNEKCTDEDSKTTVTFSVPDDW
jgi:hypothetical protein